MKHILAILLLLITTSVFARENISIINTPAPIDIDMVTDIWLYVKKELDAPDNLKDPVIVLDWEVPIIARMGFQFPTEEYPNNLLQISVAPRTVDSWSKDMISWGIGHEITHYVLVMKENGWNTEKTVFVNKMKHHCNKEFKRITRGIADLIYKVYHSEIDRSKMYNEVEHSCRIHPEQ
jgi:hypothetical protein